MWILRVLLLAFHYRLAQRRLSVILLSHRTQQGTLHVVRRR